MFKMRTQPMPSSPTEPVFIKKPEEPRGTEQESKISINGIDQDFLDKIISNLKKIDKEEDKSLLKKILENLNLPKLNFLQIIVVVGILSGYSNGAQGRDNLRQAITDGTLFTEIDKGFEIVNKIGAIEYQLYVSEPREAADVYKNFEEKDENIMTWNLYHEGRGEPIESKLAIMLCTLNRMESPRFPKSLGGVVFQKFAYSWTLAKAKLSHIFDNTEMVANKPGSKIDLEKVKLEDFSTIRNIATKYISKEKTLLKTKQDFLQDIKTTNLVTPAQMETLSKATTYHKYRMLEMPNFLKEIKTVDTFRRVAYIEYLYNEKKDPRVVKLGTQLYYLDTIKTPTLEEWKVPEKYKTGLKHTNIKAEAYSQI